MCIRDRAPALWFRFGAPQEAPGLTLAFDEAAGEWPAEVRVAVLDSAGRPLLDEAFFPQSPVPVSYTHLGALAGFAAFAEEFCRRDPAALRGPDSMPLFVLPGGGMTAGEDETLRRAFGL